MSARRAVGVLACAFFVSTAASQSRPAPLPAPEMRGLWVVRTALVSPREVDRVVDAAADGGFNALFVQVRGRGDAFYRSDLVPRSTLLGSQPRDFDPLARLLARARARGLQVHGWVNVLLAAHFGQPLPRGHVLERHPEWAMVPRSVATAALVASGARRLRMIQDAGRNDGDVEGYYLSPSVPGVADHLAAAVRELVREYRLDGLHLDFVRYPGPGFDYSRAALEGFRRRSGGSDVLAALHGTAAWDDYRRDVLTALTTRLADAARSERPGLVVSAAVAPDEAEAVHHKFQDWPSWLASGVLAAVCPMTYTADDRLYQQQIADVRRRAVRGQPVWAGIAAYRLDAAALVGKVELARACGAGGVVVFSHESLDASHLRLLREQAFPEGASGHRQVPAAGSP